MKTLLAAAVVAGGLLVVAPSTAHAQDTRPCVSKVEYQSLRGWTRAELLDRWDVGGLTYGTYELPIGTAQVFPRCGYSKTEGWYGVVFEDGVVVWGVQYKTADATLHGRPRHG